MTLDAPLRDDVRLLGSMLGDTLREQGGGELFHTVESVRALAKGARGGNADDSRALAELLSALPFKSALSVARAFSHFLNLANIAEQHHRVRRYRAYQRSPDAPPLPGSCEEVFRKLIESGVAPDALHAAACKLEVELVLTSHPTEIARRTLLQKNNRIAAILADLDRPDSAHIERQRDLEELRREITAYWLTDEVQHERPTPADEARSGLFYFEQTIWDAVPRFLRSLDASLRKHTRNPLPLDAAPVRFGSWMGGDRDGNPHVTPEVTRRVCLLARWIAADLYVREVRALQAELSMATCGEELRSRVGPAREPYRELMLEVGDRLRATLRGIEEKLEGQHGAVPGAYEGPEELEEALLLCYRSLHETGAAILADGRLLDLIRRLYCFGLTLVRLDLRQEAERHTEVLGAVTRSLGLGSYAEWDEEKRLAFLLRELSSGRPLLRPDLESNERIRDVLETFSVAAEVGPDSLGAYVISMARAPSDILAVELLQLQAVVRRPLPVVPLFESVGDLRGAGEAVRRLLAIPWFRERIGGRLQVMIGYSDSAKTAGLLTAAWELYKAQEEIAASCSEGGVRLILFHGRGGPVGRGGGPAHMAILSLPPGSVDGRLRATQQGEIIQTRFGIPGIALRTLENYVTATLQATLTPSEAQPTRWRELMERLSAAANAHYRSVVYEDPRFPPYFRAATPEEELGHLNIGSRPARRRAEGGIDTLRAIPWNFAWTQTRLFLPTWLGVGEALGEAIAGGEEAALREMYHEWKLFRSALDLIETVLAKTDLSIAERYDEMLVPEHIRPLGEDLRERFRRTVKAILTVTGQENLLEKNPRLRHSIEVRNPYVDPINIVQVELLRRLRSDQVDQRLRDALLVTINGIAAGMRNTG